MNLPKLKIFVETNPLPMLFVSNLMSTLYNKTKNPHLALKEPIKMESKTQIGFLLAIEL